MKKKDSKKYYKVLAVAAIFAATACSHSDEPSSSQNERRIEFETTISNYGDNTRQADITTTENFLNLRFGHMIMESIHMS